jgi:hypothetical protein
MIKEGLLLEVVEAFSPSVGGVGRVWREVEEDAGLCECYERVEGEQEPVESVELRRCECVLEVSHSRCDRVLL